MVKKTIYSLLLLSLGFLNNSFADKDSHSKLMPMTYCLCEPQLLERKVFLSDSKSCEKIDIMFLIDTTDSMKSNMEKSKMIIEDIINIAEKNYQDVRYAVSRVEDHPLCDYGDFNNLSYELIQYFTDDVGKVLEEINCLYVKGGNDPPEAYAYALREASNDEGWRNDAKRKIVLIADSYDRNESDLKEAIKNNHAETIGIIIEDSYFYYWEKNLRAFTQENFYDIEEILKKDCEDIFV